jgi:hypothetical protein
MGILGLLDRSEYARKSTTLARRKICNSCEFQWKPQKQCSLCYCFTHFKTMLTKEGILVINVPNKYALATRFQHLYVQLGFKKQVSKEWGKDVNRTPDHLFEPNTKSMLMLLERNNFEVLDYFSYSRKDAASNKSVFAKIYNRYFNWGSNLSFIVRNKN